MTTGAPPRSWLERADGQAGGSSARRKAALLRRGRRLRSGSGSWNEGSLGDRERLAADVGLAVGGEPGQGLAQRVEGGVARRVPELLAGTGDAGGDAAGSVLAGDASRTGPSATGELIPGDEVQHRFAAEPLRRADGQS